MTKNLSMHNFKVGDKIKIVNCADKEFNNMTGMIIRHSFDQYVVLIDAHNMVCHDSCVNKMPFAINYAIQHGLGLCFNYEELSPE